MSVTERAAPAFSGFPDGKLRATVLPTLFITEVVGGIDDLAELKLAVYLFWRFGESRTNPSFLTRREIEVNLVIHGGLGGVEQVGRALERVVERRLVLRRTIELGGRLEECFFLNTARGRQTVRDLESGRIDVGQVVVPPEEPTGRANRSNIFQLYEQNVGMLTPLIVEELSEAERRYAGDWIEEAFRQAVAYNRRNWKYIQRILERWASDGKETEAGGAGVARDRSRRANGADR
jgi:DnaD/phage-associated family protein